MRRLRLPAALTVTIVVAAPACSGDGEPFDAGTISRFDARTPGGDGSAIPDAGADGGSPDAGLPDAATPVDAPPDTPIT